MPGRRASEAERRAQILAAAEAVAVRDRLDALTVRAVAAEAGLSPGLVFFHYKSKESLLVALLEHLLATQYLVWPPPAPATSPRAYLLAHLRHDLEALLREPAQQELLFDYWVLGRRQPAIRAIIRASEAANRAAYRALVEAAMAEAAPPPALTAAGLTAVVVGLIDGCATQTLLDPATIDVEAVMGAVAALLPAPAADQG